MRFYIQSIFVGFVLTILINTVAIGQVLSINCGSTPLLDGIASPNEWNGATPLTITQTATKTTTVLCMHDSTNLYFLFYGYLESNIRFPEIMIDANNSKETAWQADDWWFHVSATDCEFQGNYNDYSNCLAVQPDWIGINNLTMGAPITDTVEISIPFSKIGYSFGSGDSLGIALDVTNTSTIWNYFPSTANRANPSTWSTAVIACSGLTIAEKSAPVFQVYPNPTNGDLTIESPSNMLIQSIQLIQTDGKIVFESNDSFETNDSNQFITLPTTISAGNYLLVVCHSSGIERLPLHVN